MKFAILASTAILLSTGFAFAADTDASTAGRPTGVLSQAECVATWHAAAGEPLTRFHRAHDRLVPVNARGIIQTSSKPTLTRMARFHRMNFSKPANWASSPVVPWTSK